jgi:NUMOD3 motif
MPVMFYTYLYRDPKDDTPIYVGKGTDARAWVHLNKSTNTRLDNTLRKREREGYAVEPIINFEVDEATALEMEKFWIDFYGRADLNKGTLFNLTDGGDGPAGAIRSEETKARISEAQVGHSRLPTHTEESKQKMRDSLKGRVGHRAGKTHSEESRKKMTAAHNGKTGYWTGKCRSEETKRKISETKRLRREQIT